MEVIVASFSREILFSELMLFSIVLKLSRTDFGFFFKSYYISKE